MVTRVKKQDTKPTIVKEQHTGAPPEVHSAMDELYSSKPERARFIISMVAAFLQGAVFGFLAEIVINTAVVAAFAFTGSGFLAFLIWMTGWCIALYAFIKMPMLSTAIAEGKIDQLYADSKEYVSDKYTAVCSWYYSRKAEREMNAARTVH